MFEKILGNVREDSEACSRRFQGLFEKISGNFPENYEECSTKIPGNVQEDLAE